MTARMSRRLPVSARRFLRRRKAEIRRAATDAEEVRQQIARLVEAVRSTYNRG